MDASRFDRIVRALAVPGGRRPLLGGLLAAAGAGLVGLIDGEDGEGAKRAKRGRGGPTRGSAVRAERKKKRKKRCKPKCSGKVCGPNGCRGKRQGVCGTCSGQTVCDAAGQCVGCRVAGDCAKQVCNAAACEAETCAYTPVANDPACVLPRRCRFGACIECLGGGDCALRACNDVACRDGACVYTPVGDGSGCGEGLSCCRGGCVAGPCCDVCASGCPFTTIGAAIDAASPGATIRVCPGTYSGYLGIEKNLILAGMGPEPEDTVLTRTPPFIEISADRVTLRNLTVSGARSGRDPVIANLGGDVTLDTVRVEDNFTESSGGTIGVDGGSLTLIDCFVLSNSASDGAGISSVGGAEVTLVRTRVDGNSARSLGGGIYNGAGTVRLTDNSIISNNVASTFGAGGIYNDGGVVIVDSTSDIFRNTPRNCLSVNGGTGC